MLKAVNRMRRSSDFAQVIRRGRRSRAGAVVVHHLDGLTGADADEPRPAAIVGLVVGKSVGSSVIRHRVSRRLRAQLATRLERLPDGSGTVVRALPPAAGATSAALGDDLDRALARLSSGARPR